MYEKMTVIICFYKCNFFAQKIEGWKLVLHIQNKADNFPQNKKITRIISMEKLFKIPYRH